MEEKMFPKMTFYAHSNHCDTCGLGSRWKIERFGDETEVKVMYGDYATPDGDLIVSECCTRRG
jgi:hypothetical protein